MGLTVLVWVSVLTAVLALPNYQDRFIYMGENDNVCAFGQYSDKVQISLNLDGLKHKQIVAWGKTGCPQRHVRFEYMISPTKDWSYIDLPQQRIQFEDQTIYVGGGGSLVAYAQRSRVVNPVRVDGVEYNCTLLGNGKASHFGIDFPDEKPAQINLKCDHLPMDVNAELNPTTKDASLLYEERQ